MARRCLLAIAVALTLHAALAVSAVGPAKTITPYRDAKPILESLRADLLPPDLRDKSAAERQALWAGWAARHEAAIRARIVRGDEESIVNFLVFGTTFTTQPRIAGRAADEQADVLKVVERRLDDLTAAAAAPGGNERLQLVRKLIARKGISLATPAGRASARRYLAGLLARTGEDVERYNRASASLQSVTDPRLWAAMAATFFRDRGLSSDTTLLPGFAIEETLRAVKAEGLLADGVIRRVAIVGPGLDFSDKESGYDFYPPQTLQPFAVADSLIRLGLSNPAELQVTTFDLSARVNQHIDGARRRAEAGRGYQLQLARDERDGWTDPLVAYWQRFGEMIGEEADPLPPPASLASVRTRAVRVRPAVVASITPIDLDIVLQRLEPLPVDQRWDLVIATSVLVYYDVFDQSLAVTNIARMLRPAGLLLSSDVTFELPATPMKLVGYTDVQYAQGQADRIAWFQPR
jgi:hypothetical protein